MYSQIRITRSLAARFRWAVDISMYRDLVIEMVAVLKSTVDHLKAIASLGLIPVQNCVKSMESSKRALF